MSAYQARVHRVMDHVRRNLQADLSLAALAKVAAFSPYHFHRIFKSVTGETVAAYTRRVRLERAVFLMRGAPDRELSSIALEVGFRTPSEFSRVFRGAFGLAPSAWDRRSRLDPAEDLVGDGLEVPEHMDARVVRRPACRLIYLRVRDPWRGEGLARGFQRLVAWALEHGVDPARSELVGISWDSEKATPPLRMAIVMPSETSGGTLPRKSFTKILQPITTSTRNHATRAR